MDTNQRDEITVRQLSELLIQALGKKRRFTRQDLQEFLRDPTREGTLEERREAMLRQVIRDGVYVGGVYSVNIKHRLPFKDRIKAVVGKNAPHGVIWWSNHQENLDQDQVEMTLGLPLDLCDLNREADEASVSRHVASFGFQPAGLEELLAFGEKFSEVMRYFVVAALGMEIQTEKGLMHPYLAVTNEKGPWWWPWRRKKIRLKLGLYPVGWSWPRDTKFLIMRKEGC